MTTKIPKEDKVAVYDMVKEAIEKLGIPFLKAKQGFHCAGHFLRKGYKSRLSLKEYIRYIITNGKRLGGYYVVNSLVAFYFKHEKIVEKIAIENENKINKMNTEQYIQQERLNNKDEYKHDLSPQQAQEFLSSFCL